MYIPIELTAKNFQSFESLYYSFQVGKSLLIQGENLTDDGQKSNGSGKSTFGEIIYYCLLGSSSSGKRDIKLIRRGETESQISLTLKNTISNSILKIERTLYTKKSSTLKLFIDSEDQKDRFPGPLEGNKLLLELIGISSEDLKNFFLINRDRFTPFFKYSDTDARELVSRFINITPLSKIVEIIIPAEIEEVESQIEEVESEILSFEKSLLACETKVTTSEEQINLIKEGSSRDVFEKQKKETLEKLTSEIELLDSEIKMKEKEKETQTLQVSIVKASQVLSYRAVERLNKIDYTEKLNSFLQTSKQLNLTESSLNQDILKLELEVKNLQTEIKPIKDTLLGTIECPSCHHTFIPGENLDVSEAEDLVKETDLEIERLQEQISDIRKKIEKEVTGKREQLAQDRSKIDKKNQKKLTLIKKWSNLSSAFSTELLSEEGELKRIDSKLTSLSLDLAKKKTEKTTIEATQLTDSKPIIDKIEEQIEATKKEIEKIKKQIEEAKNIKEELLDLLTEKQVWIANFKKFLVYLTNKSLKYIQELCNGFLEKIETDLRVKIEGFRYLSDNSTKDKITINIMRGEIEEEDYRCFSGGERGKLIFSTILAFQWLINSNSKSGGLDLLMIDEILDSVDGVGMKGFISALNNLGRTILLTTHISTEDRDENVLLIKKVNNKSYVVN